MVPQLGQVCGQGQQCVAFWQRRPGCAGGGQSSFGIGERDEFGFPFAFEGAGNEPVVRVDVAEGLFGAVGFVAGAFDGEFGGAVAANVAAGQLVSGLDRELQLLRGDGSR